jgi:MOSC domain-containing protein YiiM
MARVESINVSDGGVPKRPIQSARITREGVEGDRQRDLRFHGGPERAVTLFSSERIDLLRAEGHPITAGSTGENLTLSGLDWDEIGPGARLRVGDAEIEITRHAAPCAVIRGSFADGDSGRISEKAYPGWSRLCARVLREGVVQVGDTVEVDPTPPGSSRKERPAPASSESR